MRRNGGDGATGANGRELQDIIETVRAQRTTAQEFVLESLRQAVLAGVLAPGARLRQEELADAFGTSRIPIREALRALEYEGLVTSEPHRGSTVSTLDADDIEEVYELRILLEGHAIRMAVPLMTDEDLEELARLFDAMQNAASPDEQLAAREQFYTRLYSITGRPRLVGLISRLRQEVARALRWATVQHSGAVHEGFYEAVKVGDAERAVAQLSAHYRRVAALIRRHIKEAEAHSRADGGRRVRG
jgi:DNA-binding GntR family transcriptional regulator